MFTIKATDKNGAVYIFKQRYKKAEDAQKDASYLSSVHQHNVGGTYEVIPVKREGGKQ